MFINIIEYFMNEIIFQDLRFEVEERIKDLKIGAHNECYAAHKKTLEGAPAYAECLQAKILQLAEYEKKAKNRLIFLQLKQKKSKQEFHLTEEIGNFLK